MKVILTGKNSYIAVNTCKYLTSKGIDAECISVRNGIESIDLTGVDVIIHCAAVVHKKEADYVNEYEMINYKLTKELADKAMKFGVKQFIFLSTMAVYGVTEGEINKNTHLEPKTLYGKSKLKAEKYLLTLNSESFKVVILRPPMVYGLSCPGNYSKLSKIAKITPVIPDTMNKKSLIYIENLAYIIYQILIGGTVGIFMPMDEKYISTAELMKQISGRKCSKFLGKMVKLLNFSMVKKAFGTLYYAEDTALKVDYISFNDAVRLSER